MASMQGDGESESTSLSSPPIHLWEPPLLTRLETYFGFCLLVVVGRVRDALHPLLPRDRHGPRRHKQRGYAPLLADFDSFYARRLKKRLDDCFARVVRGKPGRTIPLLESGPANPNGQPQIRNSTQCLNFGSYNYLGLAEAEPETLTANVDAINSYGLSHANVQGGPRSSLHRVTEDGIARFVGKEAAIVMSMGFGSNVAAIEALVDSRTLVISDALNHASIRFACKLVGARVAVFRHNDVADLERVLRRELGKQWPSKILVIVEGIYSMEGTICDLPGVLRLKSKWKFNLFVDEAHSIAAIGPTGRGLCEYHNIPPSSVDVLMGTFSKAFGAVGGYIAASAEIIQAIRATPSASMSELPSPVVLQQINSALSSLQSSSGQTRVRRLAYNSKYLRERLIEEGFVVYGDDISPVVPLVVFSIAKMTAFSREMLARKIAVVIVGYPATSMHTARARLCVSAAHTTADIDSLVDACNEVGDLLMLKYTKKGPRNYKKIDVK